MSDPHRRLGNGKLTRLGLFDADGIAAGIELLRRREVGELETVRIVFADTHGILRGKTVVADALGSVLADGLAAPSTLLLKDTSHRTVFPVWSADEPADDRATPTAAMRGAGDLLLVPDPSTFRVLPWSPRSAWLFCEPYHASGATIPFAPRPLLRAAIDKLAATGKSLVVGLEIEFHVFECVDARHEHRDATMPGRPVATRNLDQGYQFLTESRYDRLEPVMDDLRRHCQALGLPVRSMEVEMGPSQFEFTFDPADPLTHADNLMRFRAMTKAVCARQGLHATFMCRPALDNAAASGWHLHQSLVDVATGANLMMPTEHGELSDAAHGWIAGLLEHAAACCLLTTPTVNGYKRYRPHQLAPTRIQWGRDNRGAMIRALMAPGDSASRVENRVPETAANPYHVIASQILSGLDGLSRGLRAPAPVEAPYESGAGDTLPDSLLAAIDAFDRSAFLRRELGDTVVDHLVRIRRAEWDRYHQAVSAWEQAEYFNLY